MAIQVEGVYRNGRIELLEQPENVAEETRAVVTFVPADEEAERQARQEAWDRLMARFQEGIDFGGAPYPSREELHERVDRYASRRR